MTTIVGIETPEGVMIGADSMARFDEDWGMVCDFDKVWRLGDVVIGFCGGFRTGQVLRYYLTMPLRKPEQTIEEWLCTTFVDELRDSFGQAGISNGDAEWSILIGIEKQLYIYDGNMAALRASTGYVAQGSGQLWALGSLHTTAIVNGTGQVNIFPEARIQMALASAAMYHSGTKEPFTIMNNYPIELSPDEPGAKIIPLRPQALIDLTPEDAA